MINCSVWCFLIEDCVKQGCSISDPWAKSSPLSRDIWPVVLLASGEQWNLCVTLSSLARAIPAPQDQGQACALCTWISPDCSLPPTCLDRGCSTACQRIWIRAGLLPVPPTHPDWGHPVPCPGASESGLGCFFLPGTYWGHFRSSYPLIHLDQGWAAPLPDASGLGLLHSPPTSSVCPDQGCSATCPTVVRLGSGYISPPIAGSSLWLGLALSIWPTWWKGWAPLM